MAAAWAVWRVFQDAAEYRPVRYSDPVPRDIAGRRVIMVDFCFNTPEQMHEIANHADSFLVLDHHASAQEILRTLPTSCDCIWDNTKSGARLAWEYFHPGKPVPPLVAYVEDRDLWVWKLRDSEEVNAVIANTKMTFIDYDLLNADLNVQLDDDGVLMFNSTFHESGTELLSYRDKLVEEMAEKAEFVWLAGYVVLCAPAPVLRSETCGLLAKDMPFGLTYRVYNDGTRAYDLRFREWFGREVDVSEIAKKCGGGGHKKAAGFQVKYGLKSGESDRNPVVHGYRRNFIPWPPQGFKKSPFEMVREAAEITETILSGKNVNYLEQLGAVKDLDLATYCLIRQNLTGSLKLSTEKKDV